VRSEHDYAALFGTASSKIRGDFTPVNIYSRDAPRNIATYNPDAKIVVSIREPVSFLRSFHFQSLYNMTEDEPDFMRAVSLEGSRRSGHNIPSLCHNPFYLYYSSLMDYEIYIRRFADVFDLTNIKLIIFDEILEDETRVYSELLRFLGVEDLNFVPPQPDRNPSHALRFRWLRRLILSPPISQWLYTRLPRRLLPLGAQLSRKLFKKAEHKPAVAPQDIEHLRIQFGPQVRALNRFLNENGMVNRDLAQLWKYD
jgi:hypothetical protein